MTAPKITPETTVIDSASLDSLFRLLDELRPGPLTAKDLADLETATSDIKSVDRERQFLRRVLDQVNEAVIVTDADLERPGPRIRFVNRGFTTLTGYTAEEAVGKSPRMLQGPRTDRVALDALRTALKARKPFTAELENYFRDGTVYWIDFSVAPMEWEGEPCFVAVERDITQRRHAERELKSARLLAEQLNAKRKEILHRMSRDIRTPLHNIVGLVETLSATDPPTPQVLRMLTSSAQELQRAVEGMTVATSTEFTERSTSQRTRISEICVEALGRVRHQASLRAVELHYEGPETPHEVVVDADALIGALVRVFDNAIRVSEPEQAVTLRCIPDGRLVRLEVVDQGPGVDDQEFEHIFDDFFQGRHLNQDGHGLGLGIFRDVVRGCGGEAWVENNAARGLSVVITLPLAESGS